MAKLGKKARKFARKNLQSVHKKQRKHKAMVAKRKYPSVAASDKAAAAKKVEKEIAEKLARGESEGTIAEGVTFQNSFDDILTEEEDDGTVEDISDSDGSLFEDPECPYISESESENSSEDKDILREISKQKKKLDSLREKDPKFSKFLESKISDLKRLNNGDTDSEEEGDTSYPDGAAVNESLDSQDKKGLTSNTIDVWCWLVMEQPNGSALPNLLNGFRAACRYGIGSDDNSSHRIPNREVFSKILTFVLSEADGIFRRLLGLSETSNKENILKLKDTREWQTARPLVKSYMRSSLFLLNQITDSKILVFILSRLRASVVFFAAFPSLVRRLVKISVHLWSTGDEILSFSSFLIIRAIALQLGTECIDTCLGRTYKAFTAHCKYAEFTNSKHIELLQNSVIELYSLDIQKSFPKVVTSLQQLASVLTRALQTKKKEDLKKIYNWQYISCISLWVKFITSNIKDHDLQALLSLAIQVIRGIVYLFPAPRYFPLRFKCVQLLNQLSLSSGFLIPIASLVLGCLEYAGNISANTMQRKSFNFSSVLKVPKPLLKSHYFQEECILSTVELLTAHFAQWSYHISFPELATIPLIVLKRFHSKTTVESMRRPVKRLIDQVEKNIEFIQMKRDEVAFSPSDEASVNSFLQLEKSGPPASFTQYYASIRQNSISRT